MVHLACRSSLFGLLNSKVCFDRQSVFSRRILIRLLPFVFLRKRLRVGPAPKRFHVLFHRVNKHRLNVNLSLIFLFSLHRAIHPATSLDTPQNTNNRKLIVRKILVLFSIALIKFIHSFDVDIDIEQSKPLVRTFYTETRCPLLISGISKTLVVYVNCFFLVMLHYYINYRY